METYNCQEAHGKCHEANENFPQKGICLIMSWPGSAHFGFCHPRQRYSEYPHQIPFQYGFWHSAWACWGTQCHNICHSNSLCRLIPWLPLPCLLCCTVMCSHIKVSKASTFKHRKRQEKGNMKIAFLRCVWCLVCCVSHWRALLGQQNPVGQSMAESLLVLTTHPSSFWTFCFLHISK